jgi:hypothetical protein
MMLDHTHYVPILKGKDGEYGALKELSTTAKSKLLPLIEVMSIPWDFDNKVAAKSVDDHLATVCGKIADSWGTNQSLFIDPYWIDEAERMADGKHPLTYIFDDARVKNLLPIPVTGLRRDSNYQAAVKKIIQADQRGVCIRLENEDFKEMFELGGSLDTLLTVLDISKGNADLLLDFRSIKSDQTAQIVLSTMSIAALLNDINEWRALICAASGFPVTMPAASTISSVPRHEWSVWQDFAKHRKRLPRMPTFGDYGISHPDPLDDVDPKLLRLSAAIRYTTDTDWLLLKGRSLKKYTFAQFHDLSKTLVARTEYKGPTYSWGDEFVSLCAGRTKNPGSLGIWRKVGTNHHLTLVAEQIASFPLP